MPSAACREAIRRAIKEADEAIVEELVVKLTEPVVTKLENLAAEGRAGLRGRFGAEGPTADQRRPKA